MTSTSCLRLLAATSLSAWLGAAHADTPGLQVQIETSFLYTSDTFLEDLGVDFDFHQPDGNSGADGTADATGTAVLGPDGAARQTLNERIDDGVGAALIERIIIELDSERSESRDVILSQPRLISFEEPREGVELVVRPVISADRRYITMQLEVTVATPPAPPAPRSSRTTVQVPDGGTVLLGGLYRQRVDDAQASDESTESDGAGIALVPLLGRLFQSNDTHRDKPRLLILITPSLVDPDGGSATSKAETSTDSEDSGVSDFLQSYGD